MDRCCKEPLTGLPTVTAPDRYAGWYRYTNQKYGFSFVFPPDWELIESKNYVCLKAQAEPETFLIIGFKWLYEDAPILHLHPSAAEGDSPAGRKCSSWGR